ncbi:MAG: hypothetical protein ACYDCQ_23175 [Dehalococcoidia bacterium]
MPVFPSVEWFNALREIINHDEAYRHLGTCDSEMGIRVGNRLFKLTFEAFECTDVEEIAASRGDDLDFVLTMPYERWKEMVQNIKRNGRADLHHTLNTLDLESPDEFAVAKDYYLRDKFYRFNQSFQNFFDASAKIDTRFADAAVAG